jgi:GGDEF domain-containing protein
MAVAMDCGQTFEGKAFFQHKEGHRVPVAVRVNPVTDQQGNVIGAVQIFYDRSARDLYQDRINHLTREGFVDPDTQIPNQKYLELHLKTRFWALRQFNRPFGIFYMEIDPLADLRNRDHEKYQSILSRIAKTLSNNMTPLDLIGHWGDGFLGVIKNAEKNKLPIIANTYSKLVEKTDFSPIDPSISIRVICNVALAEAEESEQELIDRVMTRAT